MSDLLRKADVMRALCDRCIENSEAIFCDYHFIKNLPTVDAVEVVHGRWIKPTVIDGRAFSIPHCSVCYGVPCGVDEHTHYCPNCGAKMDEVGE